MIYLINKKLIYLSDGDSIMKENEKIFNLDVAVAKALGMKPPCPRNMDNEILKIFEIAETETGKTELSVDEITSAYYNLYTAKQLAPLRSKKTITLKLFKMKGGRDNDGVLESTRRGYYRIRQHNNKRRDN